MRKCQHCNGSMLVESDYTRTFLTIDGERGSMTDTYYKCLLCGRHEHIHPDEAQFSVPTARQFKFRAGGW